MLIEPSFFSIVVIATLIVIVAMFLDLISGLNKAKQRGEIRSSWGLKRTLSKFISYIGGMLIAAGIDVLIQLGNILEVVGCESFRGIPFITCMIGVFLLVVELLSIRECADEKTKTELSRAAQLATKFVTKEDLIDVIKEAIKSRQDEDTDR